MSCPDRYTKCPLMQPSDKKCKYLASTDRQTRIQIKKDCLVAKGTMVAACEIAVDTGPGIPAGKSSIRI